MYLLKTAKEMEELTNGCYDMTISPVVKAWGFTEEEHHVPTQAELDALMPLVDNDSVILSEEDQTAYLAKEGMAVDLGGIAKGYTSDAVTKLMKEEGVESALIWLGGNISAIGNKPDGNPWKIAVENPLNTEDYAGGKYIFDASNDDDTGRSTMNMQLEDFYNGAINADYLIYNSAIDGGVKNIAELLDKCPVLADFRAVKDGNVFCTTNDMYQQSMSIGYMIDDMHSMITGAPDSSMKYLFKLK